MLFSGMDPPASATLSEAFCAIIGDPRRKRIEKLVAKTRADTNKTAISANFGQRGARIGRTGTAACVHLLPRLSFSGTCGLPRFSLWRLTRCSLSPYFTSHSPKSYKYG